jgi:uncharacterized protein (DUF2267 family)
MDTKTFLQVVAKHFACDEQRAEAVSFAVFQELRDRLTPKEASDVAAQLSHDLKRMWLENERPDRPVSRTHTEEFIGHLRRRLALTDDRESRRAVEAVFCALQRSLGSSPGREGEAWDGAGSASVGRGWSGR